MRSYTFLFLLVLHLLFGHKANAQEYCENFRIASILDIPPSPQFPGGNYFLLLLTIAEDDPFTSTGYANLYFVDHSGDTISIPNGLNGRIPWYASDTIPYILKLDSEQSNQDFPVDFVGKLVIENFGHPVCEVPYPRITTGIHGPAQPQPNILIRPNPFSDQLVISSKEMISDIRLSSMEGQLMKSRHVEGRKVNLTSLEIPSGLYVLEIRFVDGYKKAVKIIRSPD